jgi:protein involved in polysaccharide export with SLBB domain
MRDPRAALAALLLLISTPAAAPAAEPSYRLGAQETLRVRVADWREDLEAAETWAAVSGEYVVDEEGFVQIPLAGVLQAKGLTTAELADDIVAALQSGLGLLQTPSASVEVAAFGPIYVLGDVATPGAYAYAPGLTALQAVALAGGVRRLEAAAGGERRAVVREAGDLRALRLEMARAEARLARIRAELAGEEDVDLPDGFEHPDGAQAAEALLAGERMIFRSRREALDRALEALEELKALLRAETDALQRKLEAQSAQVRQVRAALGDMNSLAERGLVRSPRLLELQRTLVDLESKQLDLETALFRARQAIAEADRDAVDLRAQRAMNTTMELQRVEAELEQLRQREITLLGLLAEAGFQAAAVLEDAPLIVPDYAIVRTDEAGSVREIAAEAGTKTRPGDVVQVRARLEEVSARASSADDVETAQARR